MAIPDKSDYVFNDDQNHTNDVDDNRDQESSSKDDGFNLSVSISVSFKWFTEKVSDFFSALQEKVASYYSALVSAAERAVDDFKALVKDMSVFSGWLKGAEADVDVADVAESKVQSEANEAAQETDVHENNAKLVAYDDANEFDEDLMSNGEVVDVELDNENEESRLGDAPKDATEGESHVHANECDAPRTTVCGANSESACSCAAKSAMASAH